MTINWENDCFEFETEVKGLNIAIYYFKGQLETAEYSPQCKIEVLFPDILNSNLTE